MRTKALIVIGALLAAALPALADEVESEAKVSNRSPEIRHVKFLDADDDPSAPGTQVIPSPGETRLVEVEVKIRDDNGYLDVDDVKVAVRARDNASELVAAKKADRRNGQGRDATHTMKIEVPHHMPPGRYTVEASAGDKPGARAKGYVTFDVLETLAVGLGSSSASFGSFQPGDVTNPVNIEVRNLGNLPIDIEVSGTDLVSPEATIPANRVKASLTESMDAMVALGLAPNRMDSFNLAPGADSRRGVWFSLHVPTGDEQYVPQATYRGTITLSAVVDG